MKTKYILTLVTLILAVTNGQATSYTWIGTTSNWSTSSNWSPDGVPDSADNVTISTGTYNLALDQNRKVTNLTLTSKTINLSTYTLTVYGTATLNSGTVTNGTFKCRGTLASFKGTLMDCPVDAVCGYIQLSGSTFNDVADFTDLGTASGTGAGGCTFNSNVTITHTGSNNYFTLANTTGDIFNANVTFSNSNTHEINIATNGSTTFNGNIIVNCTGGGILFGNSGGISTLATGKTITVGSTGFTTDYLTLKNFTQTGSTAQTLALTGTAIVNMISSTFNGALTITTPGILLKNSTFNGATTLTRNGSSGNQQSEGGCTFNSTLTLDNAGSSGRIRWATTTGDIFNDNVILNSSGSQDLQLCYSGNSYFYGNITINSNKVVFNTASGKVTFAGGNSQTLNGSYNYSFKKLAINKSANQVIANSTLSVDDTLFLVKGTLLTKGSNLLTMKLGSKVTGASDSSYVEGPVKKTGNTAFVFPTGANNSYRPIEMSGPSTTTSEFTGEFVEDSLLVNTVQRDSSLGFIIRNKYWKLNRTSGSSQVYVTLSWDSLNALADTFVNVTSWNGTQWKNLGKGIVNGNKMSGSIKSTNVATSYAEFALGYYSNEALPSPLSCNNVQNWVTLLGCLTNIPGNNLVEITSNISINSGQGFFIAFPFPVQSGVTLQSGGSSPKWWEPNCPLITTNHQAVYFTNNPSYPIRNLYTFEMQTGATIQNLRIRGANGNVKDFNQGELLCGGVYVIKNASSSTAIIKNCEISCFSQAGIWKADSPETLRVENCYIHKVKGRTDTGIGYGIWTQGINAALTPQVFDCINTIFDDCKTGIDGQGDVINWNITDCSLTQFFQSEDINNHNDDRFHQYNPPKFMDDNHYCYLSTSSSCTPGKFYFGPKPSGAPLCNLINSGPTTYTTEWMDLTTFPNGIPFYDVGGANTLVSNSIFHKQRTLATGEGGNGNINLPFPLRTLNGSSSNKINIFNNTFATKRYSQNDLISANNRGGYTKIADNNIDACVWDGDGNIITGGNSFEYKPGNPVSSGSSPTPSEVVLNMTNGSGSLNESFTLSPYSGSKFIQYVDLNTSFNIVTNPGSLGSQNLTYIIRPNPNKDISSPSNGVISSENYFNEGEIITDQTTTSLPAYNKPGLYGIDVLGFDATTTTGSYNFKASAWQHIPVIVKGATEKTLYFNIKDSYLQGVATTGVKKQVYLNDLLIWEEDIAVGGAGWEYVKIDMTGLAVDGTTKIMDAIHTDGTDNVLSFNIYMNGNISSSVVSGVYVWVDDVYIRKTGSAIGDNLIKDGKVELSKDGLDNAGYWFQNAALDEPNTGCGNTEVGIHSMDKRSGNNAIYLYIPFKESCTHYTSTPAIVASVGTKIDFTDFLDCFDYWTPDVTPLVPNGGHSNVNFEPFLYPVTMTTYTKEKFYVGFSFTVGNTKTLTFTGCDLVFAPGVEITVEAGGTLNINADPTAPITPSHLFSCDQMWQGITVNPGGTLLMDGYVTGDENYCKIENAILAVNGFGNGNASDEPLISLNHITFNNNLLEIKLNDDDFGATVISQCLFECDGDYLTKEPHMGEYPQFHILIVDASDVHVGGSGNVMNQFKDVYTGIKCVRSSLTVIKSEFVNLRNNNVNPPEKGIGIIAENTTGTLRTLDVDSRFSMLETGIVTTGNINVNIHDQFGSKYFRDIDDIAISINSMNYSNNIEIDGISTLQRCNIGIKISGSNLNSVAIFNNEFNNSDFEETSTGSFHNTAITVQGTGTTSTVAVYGNDITDYRIGIHANSIPNILIGSKPGLTAPNLISFHQTSFNDFHYGIWLEGCDGAKVQDNEITQNSTAIPSGSYTVEGITIDECKNAVLTSNELNELYSPIRLKNSCLFTELHCNHIDNLTYSAGNGVNVDGADISTQGVNSTETWDNTWKGYSSTIHGVVGTPGTFEFWYFNSALTYGNPFPAANSVNPQGITPTINDPCTLNIIIDVPERDAQFGNVVADSMNYSFYAAELEYKSRTHLFNLIKSDTTLLTKSTSKDSLFRNFYSEVEQLNIGIFYKVDSLILEGNLDAAADLNNSITDSLEWESNLKTVNSIVINKTLRDSLLNSSDTTLLEGIAFQNPLVGGKAVFLARALLFLEIHDETFSARFGSVHPSLNTTKQKESTSIKLFPNPANDQCQVVVTGIKKDFILQVKDMVGQDLYIKSLASEINLININTSFMAPGIYILSVTDGVEFFKQEKIVISR